MQYGDKIESGIRARGFFGCDCRKGAVSSWLICGGKPQPITQVSPKQA